MKRKYQTHIVKINWYSKIITSNIKKETLKLLKIILNKKW